MRLRAALSGFKHLQYRSDSKVRYQVLLDLWMSAKYIEKLLAVNHYISRRAAGCDLSHDGHHFF